MLRCLIVISFLISLQSFAHAECDFKTAKFLDELKDPSNINSIEIKVAKSAKFARNFFKILTSKKTIYHQNLENVLKALLLSIISLANVNLLQKFVKVVIEKIM